MKRIIFFMLVMGVSMGFAQTEIKPGIGVNWSRYTTDPGDWESSLRAGWHLGGSIGFGDEFYIEPGIFWVKRGSELVTKENAANPNYKLDLDMHALKIPVHVGFHLLGKEAGGFGLRIFGGPAINIVTSVTEDASIGLTKDDYSSIIWGIDVGAGIDIAMFYLEANYEFGLTKVFKDDPNEAKNNVFMFTAGIRLPFGG